MQVRDVPGDHMTKDRNWSRQIADANDIVIPPSRRPLDEATVVRLMESIKIVGLRNPINCAQRDGGPVTLVAGRHRLEAMRRLGHVLIGVTMVDFSGDLENQIAEIDENLIRHNLTSSEEALAIERRTALIAAIEERDAQALEAGGYSGAKAPKEPRRKHRATGNPAGRPSAPAASRNVASIQGVSKDTVRRARKRVDALGTDALDRTIGTSLDRAGELDALAALPEPEREKVIAKARAEAAKPEPEREPVSAVAIIRRREPDPAVSAGLQRLDTAWDRASPEDRAAFMRKRTAEQAAGPATQAA